MTDRRPVSRKHGFIRRREERGQSTVEFALMIPLVVVLVAALIQIAFVVYAQLAVTHAAREVARGVAVDRSVDVGLLADEAMLWGTESPSVDVSFAHNLPGGRETVCVTIRYEVKPVFGLFQSFFSDIGVQAEAKMMTET